jgi:glucose/arabinose dehydrogenase
MDRRDQVRRVSRAARPRLIRVAFAVAVLSACGDNLHLPVEAGHSDAATELACTPTHGTNITTRQIAKVPGIPVRVTAPPDDPRLFVESREGQIWVIEDGQLLPDPFLDLSSIIYTQYTVERGLLGLVFHPAFALNHEFFVYYTDMYHCVIARCHQSARDPNRADPTCEPVLQILHDRAGNHNGGSMEFGPDGYLYVSVGDGGGAGDPSKNAQNPYQLLGKILRIDVDHPDPGLAYGIPPTNPYAHGGGDPEVFIRGARNPWQFSFDHETGDLWIGDVGQNHAEEMDVLRPSEQNGANLGWSLYEGNACCATQDDVCLETNPLPCDPTGITFPKDVRDRYTPHGSGWAAIIGGQTYRGTCYPDLVGYHFYTDCYVDVLVKAKLMADDSLDVTDDYFVIGDQTSSIGADSRGELYLTKTDGRVLHLEAGP